MMPPESLTDERLAPMRHGFYTRRGGVSTGHFESLNCSVSSADLPENVAENRSRVARSLGLDADRLLGITQFHGTGVVVVDAPWRPGDGPRADAMVTRLPDIGLGIVTADCAPVLFADPSGPVIGAAHAGWRGAATGILEATVEAMQRLGARRDTIVAIIGPCIAAESYEVGTNMREDVLANDPLASVRFAPGRDDSHFQFDLAGYCVQRLRGAGIGFADALFVDTCAGADRFFSHRRRTLAGGHPIGHQISVIRS